VETRTLVALAALLLFAAKAHGMSAVEIARVWERSVEPTAATGEGPSLPESPLAIAGALAPRDPLRIQLDLARPVQRDETLLALSLDVSP
jgi:hypothetical protein